MIALGLLFAPFTYKTSSSSRPRRRRRHAALRGQPHDAHLRHRTAAIRTKLIMVVLLGLGALAYWAGSEAVLPAYIVGSSWPVAPPRITTGSAGCAR